MMVQQMSSARLSTKGLPSPFDSSEKMFCMSCLFSAALICISPAENRFLVPPLGGSVWFHGMDLGRPLPPKGGITNCLNDRVLDFGHARIAVLRDVALPIKLAVRSGDRVAMRLDPRPRGDVSLFAGFVAALMDDAGDGGAGQFVDLRPPGSRPRLAQKENRFAVYAHPPARAGVPDRAALDRRAAMFEITVEFIEELVGVGVRGQRVTHRGDQPGRDLLDRDLVLRDAARPLDLRQPGFDLDQ